jgi:hypothetical protein
VTLFRALAVAAVLPLLAAGCGGDSSDSSTERSCSIAYSGGANESVWCDAPALRTNGSGGYVLWVMAFRGSGTSFDQAGQFRLSFDARPETGVDYGFTGAIAGPHVTYGLAERTFETQATHEAYLGGGVGAVTVRFSSLPTTDGTDPGGLDGIGTVHGTLSATLAPTALGSDVAAQGSF